MTRRRLDRLVFLSRIALDALAATLSFLLAYQIRIQVAFPTDPLNVDPLISYAPLMFIQVTSILVVFYANKLYHIKRAASRIDDLYTIFWSVTLSVLIGIASASLLLKNSIFELDYPRAMIFYAWVLSIGFVGLGREIHRRFWHIVRMRGLGRDRVIIVGGGEAAYAIIQKIQYSPYLGYELVGIVTEKPEDAVPGQPFLGVIKELDSIVEKNRIQEVIIAPPEGTPRAEVLKIISQIQRGSVSIKVFPDLFEFISAGVTVDDLGGMPLLSVRDVQLSGWKRSLKRSLDLFGAVFGLTALSPIFMLLALIIRRDSPGPIFYVQERMGMDGEVIGVIKFRSMRPDADRLADWTTEDDPRITRIGKWMRSKNVDELPQLINVLLGEMSLVGPRPEQPRYVEKYRQYIPRYMERHREKAGMTGWAAINGLRGDTSIPERTKYDLWYVENWSLWLDIKIIIRTIWLTLGAIAGLNRHRGAH